MPCSCPAAWRLRRLDFESQRPLNARHYDGRPLVEAKTSERVTTLLYISATIDLARLIRFRGEARKQTVGAIADGPISS